MNRTELYVKRLYKNINIYHPYQIMIDTISKRLNLSVIYWTFSSEITFYSGIYKIFIKENQSRQQQWQDFGHEMYHYCHDHVVYDRLHECYAEYGESKADYFAYHFCVPTFMLFNLKEVSVNVIANKFNVEYDFALRRFEMYQNKMLIGGMAHGAYSGTRKKQEV